MFKKLKYKLACRKYKNLYPDWQDNEYNCGPLKFIWGIKSADDFTEAQPSFYTMNDIDLYYDRENEYYGLDLEAIYLFDSKLSEVRYLRNLRQYFKNYLIDNDVDLNYTPRLNVLRYDYDFNMLKAGTLSELYYKFDLFVKGFENYLEATNGNK